MSSVPQGPLLRARKKNVVVSVEFARQPGSLDTLEGPVIYAAGDALMTSSGGERWPIRKERFGSLYAPDGGQEVGQPGAYRKRPIVVLARQSSLGEVVQIARGSLTAKPLDWILKDDDGNHWVVAAAEFERDYDVLVDS